MNPIFFIILLLAAVAVVMIFVINPLTRKSDAKQAQKRTDKIIERSLLYCIEETEIVNAAKHSNLEYIGGIIGTRIAELMKLGMNPRTIRNMLDKFGLITTPIENTTTAEITLRGLIKNAILSSFDNHDRKVWILKSKQISQEDWNLINNTFLANEVRNNGFIMDLQLN